MLLDHLHSARLTCEEYCRGGRNPCRPPWQARQRSLRRAGWVSARRSSCAVRGSDVKTTDLDSSWSHLMEDLAKSKIIGQIGRSQDYKPKGSGRISIPVMTVCLGDHLAVWTELNWKWNSRNCVLLRCSCYWHECSKLTRFQTWLLKAYLVGEVDVRAGDAELLGRVRHLVLRVERRPPHAPYRLGWCHVAGRVPEVGLMLIWITLNVTILGFWSNGHRFRFHNQLWNPQENWLNSTLSLFMSVSSRIRSGKLAM